MADRYIPEHRRNFKAKGTFKPDELRRRREEQQVEIRKQKREENLAKRRNMAITSPAPGTGAESDEEGGNDTQVCFHVFFLFSRSFLRFFFGNCIFRASVYPCPKSPVLSLLIFPGRGDYSPPISLP